MRQHRCMKGVFLGGLAAVTGIAVPGALGDLSDGEWVLKAPREEIATGGSHDETGAILHLSAPDREGTNGYWEKSLPVTGGKHYRFTALRRAHGVSHPRRSCVVRIEWNDSAGHPVTSNEEVNPAYFGSSSTTARPDFPRDKESRPGRWVLVEDTYHVPDNAKRAVIQLHLRWAPGGSVEWKGVALGQCPPPPARTVKLAAIHHNLPGGGRSVQQNREAFTPLIAEAAQQGADLIVLPELLTCKGVTSDYASVAEPVPGPTTAHFGKLAKKHDCYLVIGMLERAGHLVYNLAVLIGPDGKVAGKYRKVTLPREEIARGVSPGRDYPVFETRFGKVGMMVCYDVFFPEVARRLAMNGAEIIALPIWGGNPRLAAARCAENGVFLVTSTYTDHNADWMRTAIWDHEGNRLVEADEWGTVVVREVDLNRRNYWPGLGDFRARIAREAPVRESE